MFPLRLITYKLVKNRVCENIFIMNLYSSSSKNAYFRFVEGSENFQVSFQWKSEEMKIEREFNFNRKLNEELDTFFGRIKSNIGKLVEKKLSRLAKKEASPAALQLWEGVTVRVLANGQSVPESTSCNKCFFEESQTKRVQLNILNDYYNVVVNPPIVESIHLPTSIMVGFPIYPIKFCILFGSQENSIFTWYREKKPGSWVEVGSGFVYLPSVDDLNCRIKVLCFPGDGIKVGPKGEAESKVKVEAGPGFCPFETRHNFTKETTGSDSFRIVSYNILADLYAETVAAKTELFPYCPTYAMALDYRKHLILREILGYNGDIVCLQEVGKKLCENDLKLVLRERDLEGVLALKKDINEGVATFYSRRKFKLVQNWRVVLSDEIRTNPIYYNMWARIKNNEELTKNFLSRGTVVQVLLLDNLCKKNEKLVVANMHFYFSPCADHIRLLQGGMAMALVTDIVQNWSKSNPEDNISIILCGDFNSTPECGVYEFMVSKHIHPDHPEWKSTVGEFIDGLELRHGFNLASACGTPEYTNFTVGFVGCLDYIFYQTDRLSVQQVIPFPSDEEVRQHTALPSVVFPSDHVALVADIKWN